MSGGSTPTQDSPRRKYGDLAAGDGFDSRRKTSDDPDSKSRHIDDMESDELSIKPPQLVSGHRDKHKHHKRSDEKRRRSEEREHSSSSRSRDKPHSRSKDESRGNRDKQASFARQQPPVFDDRRRERSQQERDRLERLERERRRLEYERLLTEREHQERLIRSKRDADSHVERIRDSSYDRSRSPHSRRPADDRSMSPRRLGQGQAREEEDPLEIAYRELGSRAQQHADASRSRPRDDVSVTSRSKDAPRSRDDSSRSKDCRPREEYRVKEIPLSSQDNRDEEGVASRDQSGRSASKGEGRKAAIVPKPEVLYDLSDEDEDQLREAVKAGMGRGQGQGHTVDTKTQDTESAAAASEGEASDDDSNSSSSDSESGSIHSSQPDDTANSKPVEQAALGVHVRSKFDSGSEEEGEVGMSEDEEAGSSSSSNQGDDPDNDPMYLESPPQSPVILKPELPPYLPALQGCRSVEEFNCLNRIEEGTYGVVYRALEKKTNEVVALKRLKMEKEKEGFPITSLREINTLLKAQHPNIVTCREIVVGSNMDKIYIVMDYVEHDLKSLMESMKENFITGEVKTLLIQLLRGVAHLHDNWIIHRDLKTSNLLLSHKGILKIGDFGLAREYGSPLKAYTPIVVTLWYRAPELLLSTKLYSTAIDMWSVGCIFAELLKRKPLFPGKSEIDELNMIFKGLGTPTEKIWPGLSELPAFKKVTFAEHPYNTLKDKLGPIMTEKGFDLLNRMLTYDPQRRISAEDALKHFWLAAEAPSPISPSMFPTWPAKSEQNSKRIHGNSPKPPSGGKAYANLLGEDDDEEKIAGGFHLAPASRAAASAVSTFSLKF